MKKLGLAGSTALAVLVACTGSVSAQDIDAFLARFKAVMTENGSTVEWASTEEYDNDDGEPSVRLSDGKITNAGGSAAISSVELSGISQEDDGWHVETMTVPSVTRDKDGTGLTVSDISMDGVVIAPEGEENAYGGTMLYEAARVGNVVVVDNGTEVFTMADAHVELDAPDDGAAMEFSGAAESFTANLGAVDDPKTKAIAAAMGYSEIAGSFAVEGSWDPESGLFNLAQYDITVEEAGTIGISLVLGGYTREFAAATRKAQADVIADPDKNGAAGLATLNAVKKQLTFNSARIRFDDDALTGKILEFVATQQGGNAQSVAAQAKMMVPFMAMQFGTPELAAMVSAAAATYLDNPQSLTIAAKPPTPVHFDQIVDGTMTDPQALPNMLGLTITAND